MAEKKDFHQRLEKTMNETHNPVSKDILWWFIHLTDIKRMTRWVGQWGISRALFLSAIFVGELFVLAQLVPALPLFALGWILGLAPIWMPIAAIMGLWYIWVWYIQALYLSGRKPILFEMRVPREVTRSPRAMELGLANLWISSGETTFIHRAWRGQVRPFFAMEIASFGGEVHFYFWTWENYKNIVETAIYGQYPEVELVEVEDYASRFVYDPKKYNVYATGWNLSPIIGRKYGHGHFDAIDAHPFKTYIDFELEKDPKEEFKVDPLSSVLDFMSGIKPHEQVWAQFVFRRCGGYGVLRRHDRLDEWKDVVKKEVEQIREEAMAVPGIEGAQIESAKEEPIKLRFPNPTPRQREEMEAIERNYGKFPFEFFGRGVYISEGPLHGPSFTQVRWLWQGFNNPNYGTSIKPGAWHNPFDYPWQDVHGYRFQLHARRFFDAYRRRSGFVQPWIADSNVTTNEGLASIWHPPSRAAAAPGIQRIPATKAEAPLNLPT